MSEQEFMELCSRIQNVGLIWDYLVNLREQDT